MTPPHGPVGRPLMAVDWQPGRPLMATVAGPPSAGELRSMLWLVAAALALLLAALQSVRVR